MKKIHLNLSIKQGIYIDVFKSLLGCIFFSGFPLFTNISNPFYLGLHGGEEVEESSNKKNDSNDGNWGSIKNYQIKNTVDLW